MRAGVVALILLMGMATYFTRVSFLVILKDIKMPKLLYRSLKYIPVSILATLIFPGIFIPNGKFNVSISNPYIIASAITVVIILLWKKPVVSIITGIVSLIVLRSVL